MIFRAPLEPKDVINMENLSVNERQNDFGVALLERFLLMLKTIRFCGSFKRWGIETFVPVYRFNSESKLLDSR
jgi:hypothetical protein